MAHFQRDVAAHALAANHSSRGPDAYAKEMDDTAARKAEVCLKHAPKHRVFFFSLVGLA